MKKQVAFCKVHVRLVDVTSGQVLYSEEGEGEAFSEAGTVMGVGERAGYDSSLNDKSLEAAITNLSSNIIENLLDKPWRAYILGYENGLPPPLSSPQHRQPWPIMFLTPGKPTTGLCPHCPMENIIWPI